MQINLRKANALQLQLANYISEISLDTRVEISAYVSHTDVINAKRAEFSANLDKVTLLRNILYTLRKNISCKNTSCGIDAVLTDIAFIQKQIETYNDFMINDILPEDSIISGKLEKLRKIPEDSSYSLRNSDSIFVSILTKEDADMIKKHISSLKKEKQVLSDKLLELNIKNEITISDDDVNVLTLEGIL
jgi:hypothetical protein